MKKFLLVFVVGVLIVGGIFFVWIFDGGERVETEHGFTVYSGFVESADECTSYETFDEESQECYFTCATEGECDATEEKIDKELDQWEADYATFTENFQEHEGELSAEDVVAKYNVTNGEQIVLVHGDDQHAYRALWEIFAHISPDDFSARYINHFIVYDDGAGETAAFVAQSPENPAMWDVFINLAGNDAESQKEKIFTLVHEFAHIYTLNDTQVDPSVGEESCASFFTGEGCAQKQSYINQFVEKFWTQHDLESVFTNDDGGRILYDDAPENFVSAYAATNPGEDIAESFATFIFANNAGGAQTVAQQKVVFFLTFPEAVALRDDIRSALRIGVVRAYHRSQ